ncbi:MAG: hypothetical protein DRJ42_09030 [Deltaproteobacteria bacterium]|nr:MAG: hypothetical protein DRJ42_09030 [Deltaproteobacteria bacterium]
MLFRSACTVGALACSSLVFGCDAAPPDAPPSATASAVATPAEGGRVEIQGGTLSGAVLEVPAGAVASDTEITVRVVEGEPAPGPMIDATVDADAIGDLARTLSEVLTDWEDLEQYGSLFLLQHLASEGATTTGPVVELSPDGLTFETPVHLTLPYDASQLSDPSLASTLRVIHRTSDGRMRFLTPTFDEAAGTLTVELDHFSNVGLVDGVANLLSSLGGTADGSGGAAVPTDTTVLEKDTPKSECSVFGGVADGIDRFQEAVLYSCSDYARDFSIPSHANGPNMMSHLSMMWMIFTPWAEMDTVQSQFVTGQEQALMHFIRDQDGQTTYQDAYAESYKLNQGNVFEALMTIHNMVRFKNYEPCFVGNRCEYVDDYLGPPSVEWTPEDRAYLQGEFSSRLAPMTDIHPEISDTYGAWYHMSGLAALSLMNDNSIFSLIASSADEYIISGAYNDNFDCGEQVANEIASIAGANIRGAAAGAVASERCFCAMEADSCRAGVEGECCDALECIVGHCADCTGKLGVGEVCDRTVVGACCGNLTCAVLSALDDFRCCATAEEPCENNANCCGGMQCMGGFCECQATGEACLSNRECCDGSICSAGSCT